jgi:hypothetical protein
MTTTMYRSDVHDSSCEYSPAVAPNAQLADLLTFP